MMTIKPMLYAVLLVLLAGTTSQSAELETKPDDPFYAKFQPHKAPPPTGLVLKKGDRLAICGDSITEQKR